MSAKLVQNPLKKLREVKTFYEFNVPRRRQSQSKLDKYKKYAYYVLFTDGRVNKRRRERSRRSREGNKKNESLTVIGMGLKDELLRLLRGVKRTFNCRSSDLYPQVKPRSKAVA